MQPIKSLLPRSLPGATFNAPGRDRSVNRAGESKKKGANSERAELIGFFADEINKERKGTKYRPLTYRYIGVKLAHLKLLSDLYYLKSQALDYQARHGSFSKYFFGALKAKISGHE